MSQNICTLILTVACLPIFAAYIRLPRPTRRFSTNVNVTDVPQRYPYIVCLLDKGTIRECTGTLIAPEWVLTAAHCIVHNDITHIQYGKMTIPPKNTRSKSLVLDRIPHPKYKPKRLIFDIGLLRVLPVPLDTYGNLSWANYSMLIGRNAEYAGFGIRMTQKLLKRNFRIETLVLVQTRPLHLSEGVVTPCNEIKNVYYAEYFLCVTPICRQNVTRMRTSDCVNIHHFAEDSGGPLFCDKQIIGVTSWGGANRTVPAGVYTPVGPYKTWIKSIVIAPPTRKRPGLQSKIFNTVKSMWQKLKDFLKWW